MFLDLQIKRDGNGVPLPLNQQPIGEMKIEGFIPIIINVTPATNLPLLLGLTTENEKPNNLSNKSGLDPVERQNISKSREPEQISLLK